LEVKHNDKHLLVVGRNKTNLLSWGAVSVHWMNCICL